MTAAPPDSHRVTRLGPYVIHRVLGEGGMGIVYDAQDSTTGQRVALKALHGHLNRNEAARARFDAEMKILSELVHPNIVRSLGNGFFDGRVVMVLEYLDGKTLRELLQSEGALPAARVAAIGHQVALALVSAHLRPRPVVHRDLKPENIMVLADGTAKVMDFGVAKVLREIDAMTMGTRQIGTARYMSPEQSKGGAISGKADCYGLGLVLYELLTGRVPFDANNAVRLMYQHCEEAPPPFDEALRARVPRELERLVFALLEKDAKARPDAALTEATLRAIANAPLGGSPTVPAGSVSNDFAVGPTVLRDFELPSAASTLVSAGAPGPAPAPRFTPQPTARIQAAPAATYTAETGAPEMAAPQATHVAPSRTAAFGPPSPAVPRDLPAPARSPSKAPLVAVGVALPLLAAGIVVGVLVSSDARSPTKARPSARSSEEPVVPPSPPAPAPRPKPCMQGQLCIDFAPPDPTAVAEPLLVQQATELARAMDPTAELASETFARAVRGRRLDLTPTDAIVTVSFATLKGGLIVRATPTQLIGNVMPAQAPALPPHCDLEHVVDALGQRGVTVPTEAMLYLVMAESMLEPGVRKGSWIMSIPSASRVARLEGPECRIVALD